MSRSKSPDFRVLGERVRKRLGSELLVRRRVGTGEPRAGTGERFAVCSVTVLTSRELPTDARLTAAA